MLTQIMYHLIGNIGQVQYFTGQDIICKSDDPREALRDVNAELSDHTAQAIDQLRALADTIDYLKRIHSRTDAIKNMPFDVMLKKKLDLPVFCLPDGSVTEHLRQTFKAFLTEAGLLKCPKTGQDRTLYSLRHTYATFALVNDGMDIHALAKQMGTSIGMIERHYSHLTPRMKKDMFTGKRYELSAEEYAVQKATGDS